MANPTSDSNPVESVHWDNSRLVASTCNLASARSTPEGIVLSFGAARERERSAHEIELELLHRVTIDATAAARLQQLLTKLVVDYQARYQQQK
jgi:hypothetical protein